MFPVNTLFPRGVPLSASSEPSAALGDASSPYGPAAKKAKFCFPAHSAGLKTDTHGVKALAAFTFLCPQERSDLPTLINTSVDLAQYQDVNTGVLTPAQRKAIKGMIGEKYNLKTEALDYSSGSALVPHGFNFAINTKLTGGVAPLTEDLLTVHHLRSAINKLPRVSGEFVCIVEHAPPYPAPWGQTIHVGDVVSCNPRFLPAFSNLSTAYETYEAEERPKPPQVDTVVVYKIFSPENCSTAVPLLNGVEAMPLLKGEDLVLFQSGSCFRVEDITINEACKTGTSPGEGLNWIGILLTQIPPRVDSVKDMFTGQPASPFLACDDNTT